MTAIYTPLMIQDLDNRRFNQLVAPFIFQSDVLACADLKSHVTIPAGFVQDLESVPIVRGTNARGGLAHDYLSRIDSDPVVTKAIAAAVYFEIMRYCYTLDTHRGWFQSAVEYSQAWIKWGVVRMAWGYFHVHYVGDTADDIAGCNGDPFVTKEKIEALIVKQDAVTEGAKDLPFSVDAKSDLVEASEQVTEDLKDAKADIKE